MKYYSVYAVNKIMEVLPFSIIVISPRIFEMKYVLWCILATNPPLSSSSSYFRLNLHVKFASTLSLRRMAASSRCLISAVMLQIHAVEGSRHNQVKKALHRPRKSAHKFQAIRVQTRRTRSELSVSWTRSSTVTSRTSCSITSTRRVTALHSWAVDIRGT